MLGIKMDQRRKKKGENWWISGRNYIVLDTEKKEEVERHREDRQTIGK